MLTDFSPGYADTWACLDRRLRDVSQLGKAASQARRARTPSAALALFCSWQNGMWALCCVFL